MRYIHFRSCKFHGLHQKHNNKPQRMRQQITFVKRSTIGQVTRETANHSLVTKLHWKRHWEIPLRDALWEQEVTSVQEREHYLGFRMLHFLAGSRLLWKKFESGIVKKGKYFYTSNHYSREKCSSNHRIKFSRKLTCDMYHGTLPRNLTSDKGKK